MNNKAPVTRTTKKTVNAAPEPQVLTEEDYQIDLPQVMQAVGVDPNTVKAESAHVAFRNGVAILEYTVVRAVPPHILGLALMRGAHKGEAGEQQG